jgi:hypothetical protein
MKDVAKDVDGYEGIRQIQKIAKNIISPLLF